MVITFIRSRFNEEEINLLLQLLTSHPPPSPAGIRFVSLGLCMLLACPSLLSTPEQERRATDWIQWLLREESHFGRYFVDTLFPS